VTADGGSKMADKMAHTGDSIEVRDMSVRPTLKIARCYCGGKYRRSKTPTGTKVAVIYRHVTNAFSLLVWR